MKSKLEELEATIKKAQDQSEELKNPKPEPWEPRGGKCLVRSSGIPDTSVTFRDFREFGVERQTMKAAKTACDAMRTHNRLLAYADEFDGEWVADWGFKAQNKYYITYDKSNNKWDFCGAYRTRYLGTVYMSRGCAEGLVNKLKSGEVVL
jgi:hypothetical protein